MALRVSRQQMLLFLLMCTVIAGLLYLGYLYVLEPLKEQEENLSFQLKNERKWLQQMRKEEAKKREGLGLNATELQKKLPTMPLMDQFMLDLERAAVVSDSLISTISFEDKEEGDAQEPKSLLEQEDSEKQDSADTDASLPNGVEKISARLELTCPSYYHLERFIKTVETLPRIIKVEGIEFEGNQEAISASQVVKPLNYTLTVSTYYAPKLEKLRTKTSELEIPKAKGKTSPLFEVSDYLKR